MATFSCFSTRSVKAEAAWMRSGVVPLSLTLPLMSTSSIV